MSRKLLDRIKDSNTQPHPECLSGEVFLTNVWKDYDFAVIGWKTKREGKYAYDKHGELLPCARPVFIKEIEVLNEPD